MVQENCLVPTPRRDVLLSKLRELQINKEKHNKDGYYGALIDRTSRIFIQLCNAKFGASFNQLNELNKEELDELALIIYEKSKIFYFIQTATLFAIPVVGWLCLLNGLYPVQMLKHNYGQASLVQNRKYYIWYNQIKKLSGRNFSPDLSIKKDG